MTQPLLDPHNDVVFKMLFADSPPLLTDLINAVRSDDAPLSVTDILNPQIEPEDINGKFVILDILAKDQAGQFLNVEMQIQCHEQWSQRSMYYMAKTLVGQLKAGEQYSALTPVIGIHFLGYSLFPEPEQALWCFEMRDRHRPGVRLGSELQLNLIELPKSDILTRDPNSALAAWITWFKHCKDDNIMNQITHPPVLQAQQRLKELSADEETRRRADARELALFTERIEIDAAEKRGAAQAMAQAVRRLIEIGNTEAQARAMLGLP